MARRVRKPGFPLEWEHHSESDRYEYVPLRLPADVTRVTASLRLSIQAEFGGWELTRVRLYADGTRKVLLRRPKRKHDISDPDNYDPGLIA